MRLFAALLATAAVATAAVPVVTVPFVDNVTEGATQLSGIVATDAKETTVTFKFGLSGTTLTDRLVVTLTPTPSSQRASASLAGLVGGQTYSFTIQATNSDGDSTLVTGPNFSVPKYKPTAVRLTPVTNRDGTAILKANVTPNGEDTTVSFRFGVTTPYTTTMPGDPATIMGTVTTPTAVKVDLSDLTRGTIYHYSVRAVNSIGTTDTPDATFTMPENRAPIAKDDRATLVGDTPILVAVLANDRDPDGDGLTLVSVTDAKSGTAEIVGNKIRYTPIAGSSGAETLTYTVADDYTEARKSSTARLIISAPAIVAEGVHTAKIENEEGIAAGLVRLTGTAGGSVTGKIQIGGETYAIRGSLDANGRLLYTIPREGDPLQVAITFDPAAESGMSVDITGAKDHFTGSEPQDAITPRRLDEVVGRYTMQLPPAGTGATLPQGTGYARVEVRPWGAVRIVGQLSDGSKFSTSSSISGTDDIVSFPIYEPLKHGRFIGDLNFGSGEKPAITGSVTHFRKQDGDANFFPEGFFTTVSPAGSYFTPPEKGQRVLDGTATDGQALTLTLTGGNLAATVTHQIEINKRDNVTILNQTGDGMTLKIDRESGLFSGEFDHPFDGSRRKIRGALLQSNGSGAGVFLGANQSGRVTLAPPSPTTNGNNTGVSTRR